MTCPSSTGAVTAYARFQPLFWRYHGGFPIGMWCAYASEESGARQVCAGDDPNGEHSCGGQAAPLYEFGVFQVARNQESAFGVNGSLDGLRKSVDGNFWLSGATLNVDMAFYGNRYGLDPEDSAKMAFLGFAIGGGAAGGNGADLVWRASQQAGYPASYDAGLVAWANDTGAFGVGSQIASTVVRRINIVKCNWDNGVKAGLPMAVGTPYLIPPPNGQAWKIPAAVQGLIGVGEPGPSWLAVGVTGAILAKLLGVV